MHTRKEALKEQTWISVNKFYFIQIFQEQELVSKFNSWASWTERFWELVFDVSVSSVEDASSVDEDASSVVEDASVVEDEEAGV